MHDPVPAKSSLLLIQVLRALAALMVVAFHVSELLSERLRVTHFLFSNGPAGVDLFFIISGVVMVVSSRSLADAPQPGRVFFARRLERIVPLYWIATTVKLVVAFAVPVPVTQPPGSWRHIVASCLFLPTFRAAYPFPVLTVGWTLNYEMAFYALFALALALRMPPLRVLVPSLGLVAAIAFWVGPGSTGPIVYEDSIVLEFLYGVVLGQALLARKLPGRVWSALLVVGGFCLLLTVMPSLTVTRVVAWGLPALAIVVGALGLEPYLGRLVPKWMLEVGDASYVIYLLHGFVLAMTAMLLQRAGLGRVASIVLAVVLGTLGSVVVGVGVHRVIEMPLARYFRRRRAARMVAANA